ncbi:D-alanyl-D-alanine carboxypeptidase family protein [Sphingomonas aestuarii]
MRKIVPALVLTALLATPIAAQAPSFQGGAPVAYMIDLSSGAELFVKDADRRMPPASMSKMMTAYVAFDLIKKGELKLDQRLRVRPETWQRWHGPSAGSTMFLSPNQEVTVADLLDGIVVVSGNDASVVLAEGVAGTEEAFAGLMNAKAKELGMTNSNFCNSNGWPDEGCTYVTARDLAKLAAATVTNFPDLYKRFYPKREFTFGETMGGSPITQPNRDPLLGRVNGADGLKTGHTSEAGYGFTGSAERDGRRLVMVVAGLGSYNGRAEESVRFMEWGFGAWRARPVVSQGKRVTTAEVQLGSSSQVGLVAPKNLTVTIPAGASPEMEAKVVYSGPIKAPIAAGQHVADLVVTMPGMAPQTMPLVAETAVEEAGFFGRAWAGLMALFA